MRTLREIIESAKDGDKPSHDECYWAMLALSSLSVFDEQTIRSAAERAGESTLEWAAYANHFDRWKRAGAVSPKDWLGPNNDPSNPECQRRRNLAFKIAKKATGVDFGSKG